MNGLTKKKKDGLKKKMEYEANVFAVCLLIPRDRLIEELKNMTFDLGDEKGEDLKKLCKIFGVTTTAMAFRLNILNNMK